MTHDYSRIAIVTGATSGIGEATARTFMKAGFGVVGSGRNADTLKAIEKELGPAFCGVAGDAADDSVVERFFASAPGMLPQNTGHRCCECRPGPGGIRYGSRSGSDSMTLSVSTLAAHWR